MKKTFAALPLLAAPALSASTILIDFQAAFSGNVPADSSYNVVDVNDIETNPDPGPPEITATVIPLNLTTGASSGVSMSIFGIESNTVALTNNGATAPSGSVFSDAAVDGIRTGNDSDGTFVISFTGLDDGLTYDAELFVRSGLFFTADVDFTFGSQSIEGIDTTTETTLNWTGLTSSGGDLDLTVQANGSGNALTRGAAINALQLVAVPEPGILSLALGALAFLGLRRRR